VPRTPIRTAFDNALARASTGSHYVLLALVSAIAAALVEGCSERLQPSTAREDVRVCIGNHSQRIVHKTLLMRPISRRDFSETSQSVYDPDG
jgi:hypothetical protein